MEKIEDILKLITGNIDNTRKKNILTQINSEEHSKNLYKKAKITWAFMSSTRKMPVHKVEKSFSKLQTRISPTQPSLKINPYLKYAAILILFLGISSIIFYIGKQSMTGSFEKLNYTSVVADYGQISKVILPDSSIVWLNSGTTLTYNNNYSLNNRELKLSGQAFLEVRKNKKIPLIVTSGDLKVKVLGTRFDVCSYPDDKKINVILESGSIELLHVKNSSFSYTLKPGEMAEYDYQMRSIAINEIELKNYTSWKDGKLVFKNAPMTEVIKKLERKFDVEIIAENSKVNMSLFNANFENESLKEILDYIQFSCPVSYRIIAKNEPAKTKIILY